MRSPLSPRSWSASKSGTCPDAALHLHDTSSGYKRNPPPNVRRSYQLHSFLPRCRRSHRYRRVTGSWQTQIIKYFWKIMAVPCWVNSLLHWWLGLLVNGILQIRPLPPFLTGDEGSCGDVTCEPSDQCGCARSCGYEEKSLAASDGKNFIFFQHI